MPFFSVFLITLVLVSPILCFEAQSSTALPLEQIDYNILSGAIKNFAAEDDAVLVSIVRFTKKPSELSIPCLIRTGETTQWQSAVNDLRRRNFSTFIIESKFEVPLKYELADTMEEIGGTLNPPPGKDKLQFLREEMEKLEKRRQQHFSQVEVSAPGISDDGQLAIIYIAVSFGGHFIALRKTDNSWIVDAKPLCGWIS